MNKHYLISVIFLISMFIVGCNNLLSSNMKDIVNNPELYENKSITLQAIYRGPYSNFLDQKLNINNRIEDKNGYILHARFNVKNKLYDDAFYSFQSKISYVTTCTCMVKDTKVDVQYINLGINGQNTKVERIIEKTDWYPYSANTKLGKLSDLRLMNTNGVTKPEDCNSENVTIGLAGDVRVIYPEKNTMYIHRDYKCGEYQKIYYADISDAEIQ